MEVRSIERSPGRAGVPREFSRWDALSPTEESVIELFGGVLVSERARPHPKRVLISGPVWASCEWARSAESLPRGFSRLASPSFSDSEAMQVLRFVAVSERATSRGRKVMPFKPPRPNQPVEGTPSRCALRRPSPAR